MNDSAETCLRAVHVAMIEFEGKTGRGILIMEPTKPRIVHFKA